MENAWKSRGRITFKSTCRKMAKIKKKFGKKPHILETTAKAFRNEKFVKSEFINLMRYNFSLSKNSITKHLQTLNKNGWLNSKKSAKGTTPDSRYYYLSKKAQDYLKKYHSFTNPNGPLMKMRHQEVQVIEKIKEVPREVEKTKLDKTKYLGEI